MPNSPDPGDAVYSTIGSGMPARYEYRVFARVLENLRDQLGRTPGMESRGGEESLETYLLGSRLDRSVKLRDGRLEVKALRGQREGLEQWEPVESRELPVPGEWVESSLAGHLGLSGFRAAREAYDADALRDELHRPDDGVHTLTVRKRRRRFEAPSLAAEWTDVELDRERLESAAVESDDFDTASEGVRRLSLRRWPNVGYARCLKWCAAIEAKTREREAEG